MPFYLCATLTPLFPSYSLRRFRWLRGPSFRLLPCLERNKEDDGYITLPSLSSKALNVSTLLSGPHMLDDALPSQLSP